MQPFSGVVAGGATANSPAVALPAASKALVVTVSSAYSGTAATTGVKLRVSEAYASLDSYRAATHLQFELVNLDASNSATAVLTFRAAE